ncbi:MAG: hypothetical protein SF182_07420 [Deltaproteobacteria bacterium]|nr:hypothetical protein [Deltaproteobacteria bacterium]
MIVRSHRRLAALLLLATLAACSSRQKSTDLQNEESVLPKSIPGTTIPLDVREFEVVPAGANGARGVFLKLSRLPTGVTHRSENGPARIVLDIAGPTGTESPVEVYPANDTLVTHVTMARQMDSLQVVLELDTDETPAYEVLPMADWILVRIKPTGGSRPWAHRTTS